MELSEEDILRLSRLGHKIDEFCLVGADGIARLRNIKGRCFFLSQDGKACTVYAHRPLGCDIYPVGLRVIWMSGNQPAIMTGES